MKRFSRIVEEHTFGGRSTNIMELIDNLTQNIENDEKKDFYVSNISSTIDDIHGMNMYDQYLEDLRGNGRMSEFYKQDTSVDYEELRQYLYDTYQINLDEDIDCTYIDCLWIKNVISSMTAKAFKSINT